MKLKLISRIYANIARHTAHHIATNMDLAFQVEARDSSAGYAREYMSDARRFRDRDSLLLDAVKRSEAIGGCICEFGVYSGGSLRLIADAAPNRAIHGFDSFEGLPEDWREGFGKGAFNTPVPKFSQRNVQLHKGWFDQTLPAFLSTLKEPIGFIHVDCDLYTSTQCVLSLTAPYLADGAILVFDEYFNYPGWQKHEHLALMEANQSGLLKTSYLAYNSQGEQVMAVSRKS